MRLRVSLTNPIISCIFSLCRLGRASRASHTEHARMHAAAVYLSIWHLCSPQHRPPSLPHTSSLQSVTFLSREDTCVMRSHTGPWGQCLLCMSGVQVGGTREPGRGPSICQRPTEGQRRFQGRVGPRAPLRSRSLVQAWCMCTEGSQAGVPALSLAPLQTRLPWRSAVATAKQSREEGNT